jgi:uroporphyrinogen-III synthase
MHRPIHILSTKALRTASQDRAAQESIRLEMLPFIRIEYSGVPELFAAPKSSITAIFTSVHAVKAYMGMDAATRPEIKAVCCIAGATEREVHSVLPHVPVLASRPYAAELVRDIAQQYKASWSSLHFYCGDQRMPTIPEGLTQAGIPFAEQVVYHTIACPEKIDTVYEGILFFSPSAVHSFFSLNALPEQTIAFAIGHTTAGALQQYTNRIATAPQPDEEVLVAYAIGYCKEIKT